MALPQNAKNLVYAFLRKFGETTICNYCYREDDVIDDEYWVESDWELFVSVHEVDSPWDYKNPGWVRDVF